MFRNCFGGRDENNKCIVGYRVQVIGIWVKTPNSEPKRVLDVKQNQSNQTFNFLLPFKSIVIMAS
jgi:hypothetical protein